MQRLREKSREEPNGCIVWTGSRFHSRGKPTYGQMWYKGTNTRAHCVVWIENKGPIPMGMFVCHSCDNPICVNIDHLFLGTHHDNMNDMINKGRKAVFLGETNGRSKLSEDQVRLIRTDSRTYREIGKEYGVTAGQICEIKSGIKWGWLK